jgi:hypothetical protein
MLTLIVLFLLMYGVFLVLKRVAGYAKRNPAQVIQLAAALGKLAKR